MGLISYKCVVYILLYINEAAVFKGKSFISALKGKNNQISHDHLFLLNFFIKILTSGWHYF